MSSTVAKYVLAIPGVRSLLHQASQSYRKSVGNELRRYGLRYDDLLNEHEEDVKHALSKLPDLEMELRNKRLKRALDLSVKQTFLAEHLQKDVDVWNPYLTKRIEVIQAKRLERQTYD